MLPRNEYLFKNLFGLTCPVQDTAYVVYNLYLQNIRAELAPHHHENDADIVSDNNQQPDDDPQALAQTQSSTLSSSGRQASTLLPILHQFISAVAEMEDLPLDAASQRGARLRFLSTVFASGLPPSCRSLVEVLGKLNSRVVEVFAADVPATQPARQQRIALQAQVRGAIAALKSLRTEFEGTLNGISEFADGEAGAGNEEGDQDNVQLRGVYDACERLYSDTIAPRIAVAELLCAVRSALAVRTEEVVTYARKQLHQLVEPCEAELARRSVTTKSAGAQRKRFADISDDTVEELEQALPPAGDVDDVDAWRKKALAIGALRVLASEIHATVRMKLDAVEHMFDLFDVLRRRQQPSSAGGSPLQSEQKLDDLCNQLLESGVMDAEAWMHDLVASQTRSDASANAAAPAVDGAGSSAVASPPRTTSFKGSLSRQGSAASSSAAVASLNSTTTSSSRPPPSPSGSLPYGYNNEQLKTSSGGGGGGAARVEHKPLQGGGDIRETLAHLSAALDEISVTSAGRGGGCVVNSSVLYDLLGQVNLFLRRHGLAHEATSSSTSAGGVKFVPVVTDDASTFVPHELDELLGFGKVESELYARACLYHDQVSLQGRVQSRFEGLASTPDDEFFQECHDDLLEGLMAQADEACVVSPARRAVERRLLQLMVVRLKLFHHSGVVRLVTVPQTVTLDQLRQQWKDELFPDAMQCGVFYLDDGDRVMLSTSQEYRNLLRLRRSHVLDGAFAGVGGSGSLSGSRSMLSRSTVATSNDLKLELYLDAPSVVPNSARPSSRSTAATSAKPQNPTNAPTTTTTSGAVNKATGSPPQHKQQAQSPPPPPPPPQAKPDIFSQLPPGMNINEYIRMVDEASQLPQASAFIERRHAALIGGTSGSPPSRGQPSPGQAQPQTQLAQPSPKPSQPSVASPQLVLVEHQARPNTEARRMFLQMGKQARATEDTPVPGSQMTVGEGSVVVINPSKSKWQPPKNEQGGAVLVAQHAMSESVTVQQTPPKSMAQRAREEAEKYFDDDDDEFQDGNTGPGWNRGSENHVQAVMYGNQQAGGLRHNGPLRRSGVPLPPPPAPMQPSPVKSKRGPTR